METPDQEKKGPGRADHAKTLRDVWHEALGDDSSGIPAEEVFLRLERKYKNHRQPGLDSATTSA